MTPGQPANPLAALAAGQQPQRPAPAPTHAQTMAAMHYFGEIKAAIAPVAKDPNLGVKNIRPKLLDAASKLLASRTLTLSEVMNRIKDLPDDPMQQKKFVESILNNANQAELTVLQHYRDAPQGPEGDEPWSQENHSDNITGLMQHYGGRNG